MGIIERAKKASAGEWINFICFVFSITLGTIGFILPPRGEINNSVLIFIGEIGFFSTVTRIPDFIKSLKNGASIEIDRGDTHIKLEGEDNYDQARNN